MVDDVRVPAGWYPDPLGLPQLRWWDNHAWTEHISDARQPMVAQESAAPKLAYLDDLPTRRELRDRERLEVGDTTSFDLPDDPLPLDEPLRSLEAPARDQAAADEPSPAVRYAMSGQLDDAPTTPRYELDERHDDLLGEPAIPRSAFAHVSESAATYVPNHGPEPAPEPTGERAATPTHTGTGPGWILTLLPVYMLVAAMFVLLSGPDASFAPITLGIVLGVPWLAGVVLAFADRRLLRRAGIERPASWLWALLGVPVYLVVRLIATVRETGAGFGPALTHLVLVICMAGAVIAVPGLAMELSPATFAQEAENSVIEDARSLGATLTVDCPDTPPMLMQQSFTCTAVNQNNGARYEVLVSLQRANGWIDWRVDDWGVLASLS